MRLGEPAPIVVHHSQPFNIYSWAIEIFWGEGSGRAFDHKKPSKPTMKTDPAHELFTV